MTDLSIVLPDFDTQSYTHLIPSLEKNLVTTTDLLTLDVVEIAKRAKVPLLDLKKLCNDVLQSLQSQFVVKGADTPDSTSLRKTGTELVAGWTVISTLDETIDRACGGGIPTGYITEITGESGAGKTQFLLTLLLAAQLPAPQGLSRSSLYISTESALPTSRLSEMLSSHPILSTANSKPTLDKVLSIVTPDLESQDHILRYQLPVAIRRHNIGLVVIDSVAANYRAEFERSGSGRNGANMAKRSSELIKLGHLLRSLARSENIAIVVANQVADRFSAPPLRRQQPNSSYINQTQSSPLVHRGGMLPPPLAPSPSSQFPSSSLPGPTSSSGAIAAESGLATPSVNVMGAGITGSRIEVIDIDRGVAAEVMTLDHQQRFFTGWGDHPSPIVNARMRVSEKTPSLGLVWTTQIACRIALIKKPVSGIGARLDEETNRGEAVLRKWKRGLRLVFAPWVEGGGKEVEFDIVGGGIRGVIEREKEKK